MLFAMVEVRKGSNPLEAFIQDVDYVQEAGLIRIFCGNLLQYNYPEFIGVVEWAKTHRRTTIEVIAGPIVLRNSPLLDLKEKQVLDRLTHDFTFGFTPYFHLVQTEDGVRRYHAAPTALTTDFKTVSSLGARYMDRFSDFLDLDSASVIFEGLCARIEELQLQRAVPYSELLPFTTTADGLKELMDIAAREDLVFECLEPQNLLKLPRADEFLRPCR